MSFWKLENLSPRTPWNFIRKVSVGCRWDIYFDRSCACLNTTSWRIARNKLSLWVWRRPLVCFCTVECLSLRYICSMLVSRLQFVMAVLRCFVYYDVVYYYFVNAYAYVIIPSGNLDFWLFDLNVLLSRTDSYLQAAWTNPQKSITFSINFPIICQVNAILSNFLWLRDLHIWCFQAVLL